MKLHPTKHEDERRVLTEYISGIPFKRAKVIEVKKKSILGKHYHFESDSVFYILRGKGNYTLKSAENSQGKVTRDWLFEGDCLFVPRCVIHTFELYPGTIMLEASTEIYNKNDEIQVAD